MPWAQGRIAQSAFPFSSCRTHAFDWRFEVTRSRVDPGNRWTCNEQFIRQSCGSYQEEWHDGQDNRRVLDVAGWLRR